MSQKHYVVRRFQPDDKAKAYDICYNRFYQDEPLTRCLLPNYSINTKDGEVNATAETQEALINSNSLVVEEDDNLIGLLTIKILEESERDTMYSGVENSANENVRNAEQIIHQFLDFAGKNCQISSLFPEYRKGLLLENLYVDPAYRRRGIAKRLIDESR